jgi:hypothetical protein
LVAEYAVLGRIDLGRGIRLLGEMYGYASLVGYIPVMVARWFGKKITNPLHSPHALVCSELVASMGIEGLELLDPTDVTPEDIRQQVLQHPDSFKQLMDASVPAGRPFE